MESAPTLDLVQQALNALYHDTNDEARKRASSWLNDFQKSVHAWELSDQLLRTNTDVSARYFAAQTMRTKIKSSFQELPESSHQSFRDSLLRHCVEINAETTQPIATQLCLAVADLALIMVPWVNAIGDLIQQFGNNVQHWRFMLEVLTVLPEELNSSKIHLGENRRTDLYASFSNSSNLVIQFLIEFELIYVALLTGDNSTFVLETTAGDQAHQVKVFNCLGNWTGYEILSQDQLLQSKLIPALFVALSSKDTSSALHDAASECICNAFVTAEDLEKNFEFCRKLSESTIALVEPYKNAVDIHDHDRAMNFCRVFTQLAESFLPSIIATPGQGFGDFTPINILFTCLENPSYEIADITFTFWNQFADEIDSRKELHAIFKPCVTTLIIAICKHCQHRSDEDAGGDFEEFREQCLDLVKDVCNIVDAITTMTMMLEIVKNPNSSWQTIEAAMLIISAVAKYAEKDVSIVPEILQMVLSMPPTTHPSIRETSIDLVGQLGRWLRLHLEYLDSVVQFLLNGMQQPKHAVACALALSNISEKNNSNMVKHFDCLMSALQTLEALTIYEKGVHYLIESLAVILSRLPNDKAAEGFQRLSYMQVEPLSQLIAANTNLPIVLNSKQSDPCVYFDRLSTIYKNTRLEVGDDKAHPCLPAVQQIWPVLCQAFIKYSTDERILERLCRSIKYMLESLGKHASPLLQPIIIQIVQLNQNRPVSCCLYVGCYLLDVCGNDPSSIPLLFDMFQALAEPTLRVLDGHYALSNNPDLVDDLFRLSTRFLRKAPVKLMQSAIMNPLMKCAISGLSLQHKDANVAICAFVSDLIRSARIPEDQTEDFATRRSLVFAMLQGEELGLSLVSTIIEAIAYKIQNSLIKWQAEMVYEWLVVDKASLSHWLELTLKNLPRKPNTGATSITMPQISDFYSAITSADQFVDVTNYLDGFSDLFR